MTDAASFADRIVRGEVGAIARMLTWIERRAPGVDDILSELHRRTGHAHVLGVTGPPGSGKSTLVAALAAHYREAGRTVGIIAIDPSSVYSGGAILGDRIRMAGLAGDSGVFIRSLATRGALGGLSRAALDAITTLDAAGKDVVILETVGVGQAEVDVITAAQTVAVVSVPGMGDDVQAIKAGLLETADVHVVNKADRDGAQRTVAELRDMLRSAPRVEGQWQVPIHKTVGTTGEGVAELVARFDEHAAWLADSGELDRRARRNAAIRIRWTAEELLLDRLKPGNPEFDRAVDDIAARRGDPATAARRLVAETRAGTPAPPDDASAELARWEREELATWIARAPESSDDYRTGSGMPVKRVYTPADLPEDWRDIGLPGSYPYTRGPYPTMYRGRTWTMRQIAGFGQAEETNQRFRYLISQGQTGLSVDFDMPTLMGLDSDDEMSIGEVGREGVAIDVLPDMEALFEGIDLEKISVSLTINPSAWILLAMYVCVAQDRGFDLDKLSGTIQNDILKEYVAQKEWIFPVRPSMRIVRDTIVYCSQHMARYNPVNISGYHISEAGANALQEIAFTMAITRAYVEDVTAAGVDVDAFASRLSFFFVSQADLFEEVAKFRAVRRYYARMMRETFGATNPQSMRLRFHAQTAAATLTKPQPLNNIIRTTLQALSAVLGGAQSLHTNGLDEAYTIPSEQAMKIALRTQQILADETGIPSVIDPVGGSYYLESLTSELERGIADYMTKIDEMGGVVAAIEQGFFQREISDSAYDFARRKASGQRPVIGVNKYVDAAEDQKIETHRLDPESERRQIARLTSVRENRDQARAAAALEQLLTVARDPDANLMPATVEAVRAHLSMGEITGALREVFGTYTETPVF